MEKHLIARQLFEHLMNRLHPGAAAMLEQAALAPLEFDPEAAERQDGPDHGRAARVYAQLYADHAVRVSGPALSFSFGVRNRRLAAFEWFEPTQFWDESGHRWGIYGTLGPLPAGSSRDRHARIRAWLEAWEDMARAHRMMMDEMFEQWRSRDRIAMKLRTSVMLPVVNDPRAFLRVSSVT